MGRNELPLSPKKITCFELEALVKSAEELNRKNRQVYLSPFPKDPSRWVSHYRFEPRPIEFTCSGEVEGGLSWLIGSLIDFSFTRCLCAASYSRQGGHCFDPASLFFLTLAAKVDGYGDYAGFCRDLHQQDKGHRYRELAGITKSIPDEDDLCNFRKRVGVELIEHTMEVIVGFFQEFGLIKDYLLSTDGQLESSYCRFKGCAYFCEQCREFPLTEAHRQELCHQLQCRAKRLQITCPFPEAVQKIGEATKKKGKPSEPKVALLEVEYLPSDSPDLCGRQRLAKLLCVPETQIPPLKIKWSRLSEGCEEELVGRCPKVPSDLEARVGYHIDNQDPQKKERVFGYLHQKTTSINVELAVELPVGNSTYPANADEGNHFLKHRSKVGVPFRPDQVHLLDAGYDQTPVYLGVLQNQGIALIDYNPRRENLSIEALLERGYDGFGTPYAPCARLCHSNGYDYTSQSRQYVCGLACPAEEQKQCPHGQKTMGYSRRMSSRQYPRLIGPVQRGTQTWKTLYGLRTASERTNSYDQEVIENGRRQRLRGLKAFRFCGAIRTLAQLLRRALNFVLDVTYTLGRLMPLRI